MDLPINDEELKKIVSWLSFTEDKDLYERLKLVQEVKAKNPAYKKVLREVHGMVI